ncbi:MAG: hypothetical protein KDD41_02250 [Flavobacteriales bacterium]|nr:hypothetical protein [Flavobacteriales bacterium]
MRVVIFIWCCVLFLTQSGFAQQQGIEVKGVVLAKADSTPIPRAHVLNLTAKRGVITDESGAFLFTAQPGDSILVSVLGYHVFMMTAEELPETIYMEERNYQLELFNVMPYKTYEEFKVAFINLNLKDTNRVISKTIYLSREELIGAGYRQNADGGFGVIIPGVISSIFDAFDKRTKDKAHVEELIEMEKYEAYLATKFNPELVKRITELENPAKLHDFIDYCDFSKQYIRDHNKYDIITRTFECYEEYLETDN